MSRLLVKPGSGAAWEIQLKPGINLLGRGFANDFKIDDPSVSSSHCQIVIQDGTVTIKDLGSTNGTYVNRAPVKEATLQPGQTVHLGGLEMHYQADAPAYSISISRAAAHAPQVEQVETELLAPPPMVPTAPAAAGAPGSRNCKFHPKTPGRYSCNKCQKYYCELCVTSRAQKKFCRHCGAECSPVQVQIQRAAGPKGFFASLPGAFVYPFRGTGVLILLIAALLLAALDRVGWMAILMKMAALGYLFSYMQNIIHSTAAQDDEMASLPGMDDLFSAFFTFAGTVAFCFGLPIGLAAAKYFGDIDIPMSAIIATAVLGCLYFPMAFLAVAMKDTVMAANPLVVVPAILKVPLEYLAAAVLVIAVFGIRQLSSMVMSGAEVTSYSTRSMSVLFTTFGLRALCSLANVYLLTVSMRILGLLYVTKKEKFGWFSR